MKYVYFLSALLLFIAYIVVTKLEIMNRDDFAISVVCSVLFMIGLETGKKDTEN